MTKHLIYAAMILAALAGATPARARDGGDHTSFFRNVEIQPGDTARDVVCIYCSIRAAGNVKMDLVTIGGDIEVTGKIDGDAVAVGGGVKLGPGAEVTGDAVAMGGPLELGAQAKIGGDSSSLVWFYVPGQRSVHARGALAFVGVLLAMAVVLALILRAGRLENIAGAVCKRPWWTIILGIAAFTLWVVIVSIAEDFGRAEDAIDWTSTILCGAVYAAGLAGLSFGLGAKFFKPTALRVVSGGLLLALPQLIPVVGVIVFLAVAIMALGAPIVSGFGAGAEWLPGRLRRRAKSDFALNGAKNVE
ncbi:MAG: hypothetical protein ACE145_19765 [Terriglobia bacterium]